MDFLARINAAVKKILSNPQLIYTVLIAVLIVLAFVFVANRFIGIAVDAQDRLVNVRVGSLQDAFVSFAADRITDPGYLNQRIADVVRSNETIKHFRIVEKQLVYATSTGTTTAYTITASNNAAEIGGEDASASFLYSLVTGDPDHSITTETTNGGERYFNTARAIVDAQKNVQAVALTTQTLSQADRAIERSITNSIYVLIAVIVLILMLFLRHSRIIDYMDLYRRLKEVDQLKDDFISMASHELRSPLTIIRGYTDFLRDTPDLSPGSRAYVEKIDAGALGLDALIADMLDVSRIEQGRMTFNLERNDLRDIVAASVASFEMLARDKGLKITFDPSKAGPDLLVEIDKERLHQVLVNLVGNAVKYTQKGEVEVSLYPENKRLCVRVRDTGMGISAEHREKLFQKFYRVHTKDTESIIGTGLGLWITERIVREMHGTITVESIVGVGSHFIVSFPLLG